MKAWFLDWLADPVRVLGAMITMCALACLGAGWAIDGCVGFTFGIAGTCLLIELRRV